ncbi:MAG: hypothetical protein ABID61_04425 [Candidatus Micrarchaeota archaeon]
MPVEKEVIKPDAFSQIMKPDTLLPRQEVKPPVSSYRVSAPSKQDGHEVTFIVKGPITRADLTKFLESGQFPKSEEEFKCQVIDAKKGKTYDVNMATVIAFVDGRTAKVEDAPTPKPRITEEQRFADAKRWTRDKKVDVVALQQTLVDLGHLKSGYKPGEFDRATYAAVISLQTKTNNEMNGSLVLDGKYGQKTVAAAQTFQSNISVATINAEENLVCDASVPDFSAPTTEAQKPIAQAGRKVDSSTFLAQVGTHESAKRTTHVGDETVVGKRAPTYISQPAHHVTGETTVRGDISNPGKQVDMKVADVGHRVKDGQTSYGDQSDLGIQLDPDKKKPKSPPG